MTTPTPAGLALGLKRLFENDGESMVADVAEFGRRITARVALDDPRLEAFAPFTDTNGVVTIPEGLRDAITSTCGLRAGTRLRLIVKTMANLELDAA